MAVVDVLQVIFLCVVFQMLLSRVQVDSFLQVEIGVESGQSAS